MRKLAAAALIAVMAYCAAVQAATISVSLPDFDGPVNTSGFPIDLGIVGEFSYSLPAGSVITGAELSGTFGTAEFSTSTASFNVVVDGGFEAVACPPFDAGCWAGGAPFRPFSIVLPATVWVDLIDGAVSLGVIQTTETVVRFGTPTLTINFDIALPEPSTILLTGLMLAALGFGLRRRPTQ